MTSNAYSFLPWLRTGLATQITQAPATGAKRASIQVRLRISGEGLNGQPIGTDVEQSVQLYGPGDVIGVDLRAISRTEPRPWITNVEPNYLAHIEFYDEDFPWRYSPAKPEGAPARLTPWLALVVLAAGRDPHDPDGEFDEGVSPDRPLPFITVTDPDTTLPPPDQLAAWAHVHVNGPLAAQVASDEMAVALPALAAVLAGNADNACSRVICPRRLAPNTGYHAFLVPALETGRLAGLGLDPAGAPSALHPSWARPSENQPLPGMLPYYHRWFFTTGAAGDFEALVRLLQPREPDPRVGRRDIDVHQSAGLGLPGITTPQEINGVLRLGGALQVPLRPPDEFDTWDEPYPHEFQEALAALINLADDYLDRTPAAAHAALATAHAAFTVAAPGGPAADQVDPVITPPLYGRWPALTSRLLSERDNTPAENNRNWVHKLNLDPRFRVAANFGTKVIQARQEELMTAAWAQVGEVLAANARIRAAQLAREVGMVLQVRHLEPPPAALAAMQAEADAAAARGAADGAVATDAAGPRDPAAAAMRMAAVLAPTGRALRLTAPAHSRLTAPATSGLLAGGLAAAVSGLAAAMSGLTAGGAAAGAADEEAEKIAVGFRVAGSRVGSAPVSPAMRRITRPGSRLMRTLPFSAQQPPDALLPRLDADVGGVTAAAPKTTPAAVVTADQLDGVLHPTIGIAAQATATDPVGDLPTSSDFVLTLPGDPFIPTTGGADSPEALRFKDALREVFRGRDTAQLVGRVDARQPLDVPGATGSVLTGLRSDQTVPKALLTAVQLPQRLQPFAERFIEAMAYPVVDLPMYRALVDQSVEVFCPNLGLVPPNSITLLETNQQFIEAYMVGLNHEMARELLWREYPTDQRGTPFRQFWDPRTAKPRPAEKPAQRQERLYDIRPIHLWPKDAELGKNDNREEGGVQEEDLVLVIRGELLKKYPTAAIYAHRARWQPDNTNPDPSQERVPVELFNEEHPTEDEIRLPLYEAKIEPDIFLLGFDLTAEEALGDLAGGDPGWFFVIKERPGDPRFGVDLDRSDRVEVWNDLSWPDVDPHDHGFIELDQDTVSVPLQEFDNPIEDQEKNDQHLEDVSLPLWHAGLSSADIAYILFQAPVLMAVHAQEMLPDDRAQ